jgi:hypothetical protein
LAALRDERVVGGSRLSLQWVVANTVAFTAGGAIAGAIARAMGQSHYGVATSMAEAVLIQTRIAGAATVVLGAAVGTAQWLVLRGRLRRVGWWVPATSARWALAGGVAGILSGAIGGAVTDIGSDVGVWGYVVAAAVGILALGFLPVTFQWMILRRQVHRARRWLLGSAGAFLVTAGVAAGVVGWGLVSVIGWLRPEDFPSAKAGVSFGAVVGLLYGAMMGLILRQLPRGAPAATLTAEVGSPSG